MDKKKKNGITRESMKALMGVLIVLLIGGGVWYYLQQFMGAGADIVFVNLTKAEVIEADGSRTSCEINENQEIVGAQVGETYELTGTLPDGGQGEGISLYYMATSNEIQIAVDGTVIYQGKNWQEEGSWETSEAYIDLPDNYVGKTITVQYRYEDDADGFYTPLLRIHDRNQEFKDSYSYANYYGIRAGMYAVLFVLVCGILVMGMGLLKTNCTLIFLALSLFCLMLIQLGRGFGNLYMPEHVVEFLLSRFAAFLPVVFAMTYLILNIRRDYLKRFGRATLGSILVFGVAYLISMLAGTKLCMVVNGIFGELVYGEYNALLYWVTVYVVVVEFVLAAYDMIRAFAREQMQRQTLVMKNDMIWDSFHVLERNAREMGSLRHEMKHQISMMNLLYEQKDMEKLGEYLKELTQGEQELATVQFTKHFVLNVILQNYVMRAKEQNVNFETRILVPETLDIEDSDLSSMLMNMLDNAMEACAKMEDAKQRYIRLKIELKDNYLGIYCENSYRTKIEENSEAKIMTNKKEKLYHGYGIKHMESIAKKYGSILDISYTDSVFYVQTALRMRDIVQMHHD